VTGIRTASLAARSIAAALLLLLLGLRLVGATGYMPGVDHGRLTVSICPDADVNAPLAIGPAHHHHGRAKHDHNICPYAAAAAFGAVGPDWAPLLAVLIFAVALLLGRTFLFIDRQSNRDRPPAIGPPLRA
jgi:hypothetical protein